MKDIGVQKGYIFIYIYIGVSLSYFIGYLDKKFMLMLSNFNNE